MSNNCTTNGEAKFQVIANHGTIAAFGNKTAIKSVEVSWRGNTYFVGQANFKLNNAIKSLPYNDAYVSVFDDGVYTVIDSARFNVRYDGNFLKIADCSVANCGLCHLAAGKTFDDYVIPNAAAGC